MSDKNTPDQQKPSSSNHENVSPLARRFLWADSDSSVERVIFWLGVLCAVLFVLDFIIHRHAYAPGEGLPGFYAIVGFGAFTMIVLAAAQLRRLILRSEHYYSPNSIDAELYPENELERLNHGSDTVSMGYDETEKGAAQVSESDAQSAFQKNSDQGDST